MAQLPDMDMDMDKITTGLPETTTPFTEQVSQLTTQATEVVKSDNSPYYKDAGFIIALLCFAIGAILLVIGFIRLLAWWIDTRKQEKEQDRWFRHIQHIRHLEEYSIRTGDANSVFGDNVSLYLSESKSLNGSVHGVKVKVGPFPKPEEDDIDKKLSVSVESSNIELENKKLSDENHNIKDYYEKEAIAHL